MLEFAFNSSIYFNNFLNTLKHMPTHTYAHISDCNIYCSILHKKDATHANLLVSNSTFAMLTI